MAKKRQFTGNKRGVPFVTETTLTDAQAIKRLQRQGIKFATDCAKAIHDMSGGFDASENLVAWGFRLAEENAINKRIVIHPSILGPVGPRKPKTHDTPAGPIKLAYCGENSQYHRQYTLTDGGAFGHPDSRFYGRATPEGEIDITAPAPIIELLERGI